MKKTYFMPIIEISAMQLNVATLAFTSVVPAEPLATPSRSLYK